MNQNAMIHVDTAATLCGVSEKTLQRFADAGYLRCEKQQGLLYFYPDELTKTFGVSFPSSSEETPSNSPKREQPASPPLASQVDVVNEALDVGPSETELSIKEEPLALASEGAPSESVTESIESKKLQDSLFNAEKEILRLSSINNLQEQLIELREREISELKNDRDWLRKRIEKLEEKTERDQLILASLSQTNRSLIGLAESRRSPVRAALQWLGMIPSSTTELSPQRDDLRREPNPPAQ